MLDTMLMLETVPLLDTMPPINDAVTFLAPAGRAFATVIGGTALGVLAIAVNNRWRSWLVNL